MKVLAFIYLIGACFCANNTFMSDSDWLDWKLLYNKTYTDLDEQTLRYAIWKDNVKYVNDFNAKNEEYKLKINPFSDYTNIEFRAQMYGLLVEKNFTRSSFYKPPTDFVEPASVNWIDQGYVTPVKNQKKCGSCWAFSATGAVEGQHFNATKKLVSLSEQNLVDCSKKNHGCNGGLPFLAYEYIIQNKGIDTESSYPYTAKDGTCKFSSKSIGATISGYKNVFPQDETALKKAVASVGPISVGIDARDQSFQSYSSGVYTAQNDCLSVDHGVLVVGYGSENGQDYWLVKNSWGTDWGIGGYIKMRRNYDNMCQIASYATFPVVGQEESTDGNPSGSSSISTHPLPWLIILTIFTISPLLKVFS